MTHTQVSGWFLSLVGGFNIVGLTGRIFGAARSRPLSLALIYAARGLGIAAFLGALSAFGAQPRIVYLFGAFMGLLWLLMPPTTGVVANMFGLSHMALLYGFAFFSHQVGSFVGVIMAGWFYAAYDTYVPIWYASIILSFIALCPASADQGCACSPSAIFGKVRLSRAALHAGWRGGETSEERQRPGKATRRRFAQCRE